MGVTCSLSLMATKFFHFWSTTSKWPRCLAVPACNEDATAAQQTQSSELLFDHKHKAVHRLCHQQISVLCSVPIYLHVYVCGPYTTMHKENRGKKISALLHPMWTYMWTPTLCKEPVYSNMTTAFSSVQENWTYQNEVQWGNGLFEC